jgi:hypothetical protein
MTIGQGISYVAPIPRVVVVGVRPHFIEKSTLPPHAKEKQWHEVGIIKYDVTSETSIEVQNRERNVSNKYYHQNGNTNCQCQYFFFAYDMFRFMLLCCA